MGELLKFTTWPKHQNVFYKVTSDALVFYVKGEENAAIGLAKEPGNECELWILIGYRKQCWIKKTCEKYSSVYIPDILSRDKYNKFWITWNKSKINLGRNDDTVPILAFSTIKRNLYYVTFAVRGESRAIKWMCHLPPQIEKPHLIRVSGGEPYWLRFNKEIPNNAFIGGHDNEALYIIRAYQEWSLITGKFVPSLGIAFVSLNGVVYNKNVFEILCGYNYTWMKASKNEIPLGAVRGGFLRDAREIIYIGRAFYNDVLLPGKIHASQNCCYISHNGVEKVSQQYEILVTPHISKYSITDFYHTNLCIGNDLMCCSNDNDINDEETEDSQCSHIY